MVLDRYFPDIIRSLRKSLPGVKLALREGHHHHIQQMLERGQIDLGITPIEGSLPQNFETVSLMEINVCLLVSSNSRIQSADHFWKQDRIAEPLISLPSTELVTRRFQSFLESNSLTWPTLIELSSLDLIESYVASGIGVGIGVQNLSAEPSRDICRIPLKGIETITVGALWRKKLSRAGKHILQLCQEKADDLKKRQSS